MATALQIAANQRNAQKSTGPRTEEGKARSRANALKDGLTGNGIVLTPVQEEAVSRRMESWRTDYNPKGEQDLWLYRRLVVSTVQLDQIEAEEEKIRGELRDRATHSWGADRLLEAEQLGARLASRPAITQLKLVKTAQGCEWLIERWDALIAALEPAEDGQPGTWTEEQESQALDLAGMAPERRIEGRRPWQLTGDASALEFAQAERDALAQRHEAMVELDARAMAGYPALDSPADRAIWRLRRRDQACWRTYLCARKQLAENAQSAPAAAPEPAPALAPAAPAAPPSQEKRTHCDTGSSLPVAAAQTPAPSRRSGPVDPLSINLTSIVKAMHAS